MFTNLTGVGNIEVNAFQRLADVVIQKSIREGFGLVVSEALWKGTPSSPGAPAASHSSSRTASAGTSSTPSRNARQRVGELLGGSRASAASSASAGGNSCASGSC